MSAYVQLTLINGWSIDTLKLHGWDLLIVVAYMIICVVIGLYRSTRINNPRQFALGYQNIPTTILVCILFASNTGSGTLFGYTGKLYLFGAAFLIARLFVPICYLIAARIYAPNIEKFQGCISVSQIMYKLYGSYGRWVSNVASVIICIGMLSAQALALGYAFNYFFGIKIIYGMLICYGVLSTYTALGGVRAVILTETFQFGIFFFIVPITYIVTLMDIGGMPSLMQELPRAHLEFELTTENILLLGSLIFFYILPESNAPFIQRCLMATSGASLRKALQTVCLISIPFTLSLCLIVYIVKAHSPEVSDSDVLLFYIDNYLPLGLKGLMFAGVIAAIMGLAEAWLNATSIIIVNDIIKASFPKISDKKQLVALRVSIVILSATSVMIASLSSNILNMIYLVKSLWIPLILIPLISGFLGLRASNQSFIASTVMALTFTLVGKIVTGDFAITSINLGIIGSALGLFGMHYCQIVKIPTFKENTALKISWLYTQALKAKYIILLLENEACVLYKRIKNITGPKKAPYQRFVIFTLAYYFVYTFSFTSDPTHRIFSYLLVIGYSMCFVLLFRDVVFSKGLLRKYLPLYWYCTLTFCLPSVASYMLFASQGNDFWLINGLLAAFSLYFFVDAIAFIVLLSLGIFCGYGLFLLNEPVHQVLDTHNTLEHIGYIYLFFLFAYLMLFRGREKEHNDKIGQMHMLSGAIAHEVKTPFASMIMYNKFISRILDKTINIAKKNKDNQYTIVLDEHEYNFLLESNQSVQQVGAQGITTINSILNSLKNSVIGDARLYSIEECVKKAIEAYAFTNDKAKEIDIKIDHNFKVLCSLDYLTQVFLNLLSNAYRHGGRDVKIEIRTKGFNLFFKDYGNGIPKEDLPYIFDRFYTKNKTGSGIGLAFCKMVMEDLGGNIKCQSELGKYSKFILIFPDSIT